MHRLVPAALAAACLFPSSALAWVSGTGGQNLGRIVAARAAATTFAVPLRGPLESPFGYRWGRLHAGQDIGVRGTDRVHAALAGRVVSVGYQPYYEGYGNIVLLRHGRGLATLYAHLASYRVAPGDRLERGELLGRAGCTGSCTGQHLHFEVRVHGKPVDPKRFLPHTLR